MDMFKNLGAISIAWLWACLLFMIWRWRGNKAMTYSDHAAQTKQGILYYFLTFFVHLVLFTIFAFKWFAPTLELPPVFLWLLVIAVFGQLLALLIPSIGGKMTTVHDVTAYCMHFLLTPLAFMVALGSNLPTAAKTMTFALSIFMVGLLALFVFVKKSKNYSLYLQTAYGLSFHAAVLVAIYLQ